MEIISSAVRRQQLKWITLQCDQPNYYYRLKIEEFLKRRARAQEFELNAAALSRFE